MGELKQLGYGHENLEELLLNNGCAITKKGIEALNKWMAEYRHQVNVGAEMKISDFKQSIRKIIDPKEQSNGR